VLPIIDDGGITWFDASGFSLARSDLLPGLVPLMPYRHDYDLTTAGGFLVRRTFSAR